MKDVFFPKRVNEFWSLMEDFVSSLEAKFPECETTKDWSLWYRNVISNDDAKRREYVVKWSDAMTSPLAKGCAKYAKAVNSITGNDPTVYHAFCYKDGNATNASCTQLKDLHLVDKLSDERMTDDDRAIFWEYLVELAKISFKATRKCAPSVPTPAEIDADIQKRKRIVNQLPGQIPLPAANGKALGRGLKEIWNKLLELRGSTKPATENLEEKLAGVEAEVISGCKNRDNVAFQKICAIFPELGEAPAEDGVWTLLDQCFALATVSSAIPPHMMQGIEAAANNLVKGLADGSTDFSNLDISALGQQVLSGVSPGDVASFTENLDKIVPALSKLPGA